MWNVNVYDLKNNKNQLQTLKQGRINPVSYTHLDVYKRQIETSSAQGW